MSIQEPDDETAEFDPDGSEDQTEQPVDEARLCNSKVKKLRQTARLCYLYGAIAAGIFVDEGIIGGSKNLLLWSHLIIVAIHGFLNGWHNWTQAKLVESGAIQAASAELDSELKIPWIISSLFVILLTLVVSVATIFLVAVLFMLPLSKWTIEGWAGYGVAVLIFYFIWKFMINCWRTVLSDFGQQRKPKYTFSMDE